MDLIYLHGFLSSPSSLKATQTRAYFERHRPEVKLHFPTLPGYPDVAVEIVDNLIASIGSASLRFMGSSMGGFLSTYFIEHYGGKAALINPAVRPFELLMDYQGEHINPNTNEKFTVSPAQIAILKQMYKADLSKAGNYMVLLQTGDETLDYRQAESKYARSQLIIEAGGTHSFENFETHLPSIAQFLFDEP